MIVLTKCQFCLEGLLTREQLLEHYDTCQNLPDDVKKRLKENQAIKKEMKE